MTPHEEEVYQRALKRAERCDHSAFQADCSKCVKAETLEEVVADLRSHHKEILQKKDAGPLSESERDVCLVLVYWAKTFEQRAAASLHGGKPRD